MNGLTLTENYPSFELTQSIKEKIERENESFKAYTKEIEEKDESLEEYYDEDFEEYYDDEEVKATMRKESATTKPKMM
jgi:hypothetical protein